MKSSPEGAEQLGRAAAGESRGAARVARLMALLRGSSKGGSHSTPTPKALSAEPHE